VHGWSVPATLAMDTSWVPYDSVLEFHRTLLSTVADRVRQKYPELAVEEVLEQRPPAQALVDAAKDAELLVVGSHRKGVLAGLIIGSVSHDVLLNLPCPVAVIPHPDDNVGVYRTTNEREITGA
jgi:nucleotide-binding universal stress UspA family protein